MPKYVSLHTVTDGSALADVLRTVLQYQAKGAATATALTDSSTGAASGTRELAVVADATNTAASGSSLAGSASTEAAFVTVKDALATLYAKANTAATALGMPTITYSGGGSSGGNTVAAVTKVVTGATTGVPAAAYNTMTGALENAFYQLGRHVNTLCNATGAATLDLSSLKGTVVSGTVAVISTSLGAAVDPGVTKVKADADLTAFANNVATIAARITAVVSGANAPGAVYVA